MVPISQYLLVLLLSSEVVVLSSCNFQPLYIRPETTNMMLRKIHVEPIRERSGQILHNLLVDHLGITEFPCYILSVQLNVPEHNISLQQEGSNTSRINLVVWASYHLKDSKYKKSLVKGRVRSVASYSMFEAKYSSVISEYNAEQRAIQQIANEIINYLTVYFLDSF